MKNIKLSLVAALLVAGSSAFAIENTQVSGNANLFYNTDDIDSPTVANDGDLFNRINSDGQASVNLSITTDLTKGVKAGARATVINTLGLENNLVSGVWEGATDTQWWMAEAWLSTNFGNTAVKIGRQTIDTPLVFTETWSVADNTFDAVVLSNTDIANTTLVGAYVGQTNSVGTQGGYGSIVKVPTDANSDAFDTDLGTYVAGVVNTSIKDVTAQAWFYNVDPQVANAQKVSAYWLQADAMIGGITLGAQYGAIDQDMETATAKDASAYGVKAGYKVNDAFDISVAYTSVEDETGSNTQVKNLTGNALSPLYTEAWWNYQYVGRQGADTINVTANLATKLADFSVFYTDSDQAVANTDMQELTVSASRSYGPLDTSLVYIFTDAEDQNKNAAGVGQDYNSVQVYLTYNF